MLVLKTNSFTEPLTENEEIFLVSILLKLQQAIYIHTTANLFVSSTRVSYSILVWEICALISYKQASIEY